MKTEIVCISQPTKKMIELGIETANDLIAYTARVSNPSNQTNTLTAPKLVKYLIDNAHYSPLEMVSLTIEIETTRDIARQILRHRSFSFQEFSQRYADPVAELSMVTREARLQDPKNRQNSVEISDGNLMVAWDMKQQQIIHETSLAYKWAIQNGIAKEQARVVLPEGNTVSRLYAAGTLRSWYHYCQLRMGNGTQKEHKLIAENCWNQIIEEFPVLKEI